MSAAAAICATLREVTRDGSAVRHHFRFASGITGDNRLHSQEIRPTELFGHGASDEHDNGFAKARSVLAIPILSLAPDNNLG